jgi:hypothetical protein
MGRPFHPMRFGVLFLLVTLHASAASAASRVTIPPSAYGDMRWRLAGPFRGGWATVAAGIPGNPAVAYFGSGDGGVWKTDDAGVTWHQLFNQMGSA